MLLNRLYVGDMLVFPLLFALPLLEREYGLAFLIELKFL